MALCDRYGFFNGIYGIEQVNWANYWRGIIPDGILHGYGSGMWVSAYQGTTVQVGTGQAMVDNHRVWITTSKYIDLETGDNGAHIDRIVLRVTYGNTGESTVEVVAKKGKCCEWNEKPF